MRVGVAELQAGLLVLDDAVGEEVERASQGETAPSQALERVKPYTSLLVKPCTHLRLQSIPMNYVSRRGTRRASHHDNASR